MSGVYKLEIQESETDLKQLLKQQKSASGKERVQLLYLLKTKQAQTVQAAASLLGRNRVTLQEWMGLYRNGGIEQFEAKTSIRKTSCNTWVGTTSARETT